LGASRKCFRAPEAQPRTQARKSKVSGALHFTAHALRRSSSRRNTAWGLRLLVRLEAVSGPLKPNPSPKQVGLCSLQPTLLSNFGPGQHVSMAALWVSICANRADIYFPTPPCPWPSPTWLVPDVVHRGSFVPLFIARGLFACLPICREQRTEEAG
jgi:hypothetical protein